MSKPTIVLGLDSVEIGSISIPSVQAKTIYIWQIPEDKLQYVVDFAYNNYILSDVEKAIITLINSGNDTAISSIGVVASELKNKIEQKDPNQSILENNIISNFTILSIVEKVIINEKSK